MRTEVIKADTIDAAVKRILNELAVSTRRRSSRENIIYFDGWNGLGASAVLQAVAKSLTVSNEPSTRPTGLEFQKIIHIDCSKWESRRSLQRKITEQLKLPNWVIEIFDKQDEEDDFNGLDQGSRCEIEEVVGLIHQTVQNRRFLMILHNGSNEEIDIFNFGLSLDGYANSKMLWTFQGRFRLDPKMMENVKKGTTTDVILSASRDGRDLQELWSYLVSYEAAQVSSNKHGHVIIDPAIAAQCVLYMLKQSWIGSHIIDYNWAIHSSNYWICDGIIEPIDIDKAWQIGNALQHEVLLSLDMDNRPNNYESRLMTFSSHLASSAEHMPYWISTTTCGFVLSPSGAIADSMFQHSHRLGVLKLSRCTFSFSSPPFLCCHSLRFLWLEHCADFLTRTNTADHHRTDTDKDEELDNSTMTSWECFQSLWVLDLRYTDWDRILSARAMDLMTQVRELNVMGAKHWDMSHLRGRLRNIRKLRIIKSTCCFNNNVLSEMENMELLEFSGNTIKQGMPSLSGPANNNSLETITIGGCDGLKVVTFRHCKELKTMFLKGSLGSLEELDLSGTRVKTLNLTGVEAKSLPKKIILLGCEKLHAILWPVSVTEEELPKVLHIDTTSQSAIAYGGEAPLVHPHADLSLHEHKEMFKGGWGICLTDARLLRFLSPVVRFLEYASVHIDIQGTRSDKLVVQVQRHTSTLMESKYKDVLKEGLVTTMMMWDCPKIQRVWLTMYTCFIEVVMHGQGSRLLEDAAGASASTSALLPKLMYDFVTSLHVYDNLSITSIPGPPQGSGWRRLRWCRVERCPMLHTVFTIPHDTIVSSFWSLKTLWASKLLFAVYVWDNPVERSDFVSMIILHLDHCPRLVHVLPLSMWGIHTLVWLETLEIVYCGDLREVFPLSLELEEEDKIREFRDLRRIHLHELPKLQRICGRRMFAPKLETIKIRGCWSLKRLPAVGRNTKPPKVDCEKEWWDNLEWDGLEKNHHPSLYEPSHSLYYKKAQLPRGTVLR
ncbi:hypothetical protein ACQJBY_039147 [Aegilops geniculata]